MTTSLPTLPHEQQQNGFWSIRLTRTSACLMSLFGPALLFIPLILVMMALEVLPEGGLGDDVGLGGILSFAVAILGMRFYFASWFARDKGRNRAWGIAGVFGFWGWIVLWSLSDLSESRIQAQILSAG